MRKIISSFVSIFLIKCPGEGGIHRRSLGRVAPLRRSQLDTVQFNTKSFHFATLFNFGHCHWTLRQHPVKDA